MYKYFGKFEQPTNLEHTLYIYIYIEILQTLCTTYNELNEVIYGFKVKFK
jgi:hypothetical protein